MAFDLSMNELSNLDDFIIQSASSKLTGNKPKKNVVKKTRKPRSKEPLKHSYTSTEQLEAGIDEAGRGPMFGRVYTACVILPFEEPEFRYDILKDSKRFSSKKKLLEVYDYIKENAVDYSVGYKDEVYIDENNILHATQMAMHDCIGNLKKSPDSLLVDGNYFIPYNDERGYEIPYMCIEGGDNEYCSIAAASILAKVDRDKYIEQMCDDNPELDEYYGLRSNKGYGTKKHIEGIKEHGISRWHRRSFGICRKAKVYNELDEDDT